MSNKNKKMNKGGTQVVSFDEVMEVINHIEEQDIEAVLPEIGDLWKEFFNDDTLSLLSEAEIAHAYRQEGYRLKAEAQKAMDRVGQIDEQLLGIGKRIKEMKPTVDGWYRTAQHAVFASASPNGRTFSQLCDMTKGHAIHKALMEKVHESALVVIRKLHEAEMREYDALVKLEKDLGEEKTERTAWANACGTKANEAFADANGSLEMLGFKISKGGEKKES